MKNALLALIAIGAGALASDWSARLPVVHEVAGQIFQRGKLIAVVGQRGVFEADLGAHLREKQFCAGREDSDEADRKSTRLNSSHLGISYAVFCSKIATQSGKRRRQRQAAP